MEEEGDWNWFEAGLAGIALTLGLINILEWELNVRRLRPNVRLGPNVHQAWVQMCACVYALSAFRHSIILATQCHVQVLGHFVLYYN